MCVPPAWGCCCYRQHLATRDVLLAQIQHYLGLALSPPMHTHFVRLRYVLLAQCLWQRHPLTMPVERCTVVERISLQDWSKDHPCLTEYQHHLILELSPPLTDTPFVSDRRAIGLASDHAFQGRGRPSPGQCGGAVHGQDSSPWAGGLLAAQGPGLSCSLYASGKTARTVVCIRNTGLDFHVPCMPQVKCTNG